MEEYYYSRTVLFTVLPALCSRYLAHIRCPYASQRSGQSESCIDHAAIGDIRVFGKVKGTEE